MLREILFQTDVDFHFGQLCRMACVFGLRGTDTCQFRFQLDVRTEAMVFSLSFALLLGVLRVTRCVLSSVGAK